MDEQRIESALRQGPPFATQYVPASVALDEQPVVHAPSVGRLVLIIAVTALLLVGMLAGLAALGAFRNYAGPASNGWVAFAQYSERSAGLFERDIYIVREGEAAHRIVGSDADGLDQIVLRSRPMETTGLRRGRRNLGHELPQRRARDLRRRCGWQRH